MLKWALRKGWARWTKHEGRCRPISLLLVEGFGRKSFLPHVAPRCRRGSWFERSVCNGLLNATLCAIDVRGQRFRALESAAIWSVFDQVCRHVPTLAEAVRQALGRVRCVLNCWDFSPMRTIPLRTSVLFNYTRRLHLSSIVNITSIYTIRLQSATLVYSSDSMLETFVYHSTLKIAIKVGSISALQ